MKYLFLLIMLCGLTCSSAMAAGKKLVYDPTVILKESYWKKLSLEDRAFMVAGLREMSLELAREQRRQGVRTALNPVPAANPFLDFILPTAQADKAPAQCLYCGFISSLDNSSPPHCTQPAVPNQQCPSGQGPCNPIVFGSDVCVPTNGNMESEALNIKTPEATAKLWTDKAYTDKYQADLDKVCSDPRKDSCQIVLTRLMQIRTTLKNTPVSKAVVVARPVVAAPVVATASADVAPINKKYVDAGPPTPLIPVGKGYSGPTITVAAPSAVAPAAVAKAAIPTAVAAAPAAKVAPPETQKTAPAAEPKELFVDSRPDAGDACNPLALTEQVKLPDDEESISKQLLYFDQAQKMMCNRQGLDPSILQDAHDRIAKDLSVLAGKRDSSSVYYRKRLTFLRENLDACESVAKGSGLAHVPAKGADRTQVIVNGYSPAVEIRAPGKGGVVTHSLWMGMAMDGMGLHLCDIDIVNSSASTPAAAPANSAPAGASTKPASAAPKGVKSPSGIY